eukprot:2866931-Pleurochrysis_carterae.AAC.1
MPVSDERGGAVELARRGRVRDVGGAVPDADAAGDEGLVRPDAQAGDARGRQGAAQRGGRRHDARRAGKRL